MRKFSFLAALLFFSYFPAFSQQSEADSLRAVLYKSGNDTTKALLYYQYGKLFETDNPDTAVFYYNKAYELSKELDFRKGQAAYASHYIVILNNQGKFREALALCKEALALYEEMGDKRDLSVAYLNYGSEWQYLSDFQVAAENYLKAKKLAEEVGDKRLQRITNNNLASIFINMGDYQKGKEYAEKSLLLARELKNDYAISSSTFNIATAELYLKDYDKALARYKEIEQIGQATDDYIVILDGWQGIADVYSAISQAGKAEQYYKQVIDLSKQKSAPEYEMYAYMGITDLYLKTKQYSQAQATVQAGIKLAVELGSKYELKDLYFKASDLAEKTGDLHAALDFRKKFELLSDSVLNEKNRSTITLVEAKYESEKKESQIKELEVERQLQKLTIRQKNTLNYILIGAAATLLIISLLSYRNYKQKQKLQQQRISELETEKQLMATEAVLKGEEQERTRLAKDLHDGLGGMLSGIKYSFQTMKGSLVMTPENAQAFERGMDMLDSSIREMRRVAHNMMPEALVKFGLDTALKDFCNDINQSGALRVNYQSIGMEGAKVEHTTAITIYRIVQELINNTMKHAAAKTAIVQVSKTNEIISITVEDDGVGFNPVLLQQAKGIGWSNIQSRLEYLKGRLDIQSEPGKGTSVHIELNI
ncbi:MAG: tetratricopeptide repeat protein [Chitinophagales bacterium]|nr:tetratricopeptide repeat protein [Chitinophagales bacterium]